MKIQNTNKNSESQDEILTIFAHFYENITKYS